MSEIKRETRDYIIQGFKKAKIEFSREQLEKLEKYMDGILSCNEKVNLTAITKPEEFVEKHYLDSLQAIKLAEYKEAESVLDLGTGGGFPGIPLAIMCPDKKFTLVDSLSKRLNIIDELAEELDISNIITLHGRFEDLGKDPTLREGFEIVVSRAVAEMAVLAEYALPFVSVGGFLIAYKTGGELLDEELDSAANAIKLLGGELIRIKKAQGNHVLAIIKKKRKTPKEYPRRAGTPKKAPL